jgi:hypothetical protein
MFDAARGGDSGAYLDAFAGPLQVQLRQTAAEQGADLFARSLKETNAPVKGIAVGEPERVSAQEVRVRVELVYADHNEAQWFFLEQQPDSRWKIVRLDAAARVPTSRRYGAPVD